MGTLKDTVDIVSTIIKGDPVTRERIMRARPNSLAKMASEGTLQFPIIVSGSLDIETAQNISKALERNYTTFVQTALSLFPAMRTDTPGGISASNFIKRFHQNDSANQYDAFDLVANLVEGYQTLYSDDELVFESAIYTGATKTIIADNKEQLIDLIESVRTDILNNKYKPKTEITYNFANPKLNKKFNSLTEAKKPNSNEPQPLSLMDMHKIDQDNKNYKLNREKFLYQQKKDMNFY